MYGIVIIVNAKMFTENCNNNKIPFVKILLNTIIIHCLNFSLL